MADDDFWKESPVKPVCWELDESIYFSVSELEQVLLAHRQASFY